MNERELRIGNLYAGYNDKVCSVNLEFFHLLWNDIEVDEMIKEFIPLTDEWLVKVGLHKYKVHNDPSMFNYCTDGLYSMDIVGTTDKGDSFYSVFGNEIEIKYVHQLQNLYFALTGTELAINL